VDEAKNGLVSRSKRIKAKAHLFDLETGKEADVLLKLSGYPAVVFQHEYDHLQGVLFIDRVKESLPSVKPIEFAEMIEEAENQNLVARMDRKLVEKEVGKPAIDE
jgi:peptide deformylase